MFAQEASLPVVAYAAHVLDQAVLFAYSIYLHGTYGQTIGKWIMKVQVLSIDETRLTMRQAFLRDSIGVSLAIVYLLFAIAPVFSGVSPRSREFEQQIPSLIWNVGLVTFALEIITMLTNAKRRALHDFIAGSVVVRRSNSTIERDARQDSTRPSL
jgi:uncharacterized RDD family membrane protein YckC